MRKEAHFLLCMQSRQPPAEGLKSTKIFELQGKKSFKIRNNFQENCFGVEIQSAFNFLLNRPLLGRWRFPRKIALASTNCISPVAFAAHQEREGNILLPNLDCPHQVLQQRVRRRRERKQIKVTPAVRSPLLQQPDWPSMPAHIMRSSSVSQSPRLRRAGLTGPSKAERLAGAIAAGLYVKSNIPRMDKRGKSHCNIRTKRDYRKRTKLVCSKTYYYYLQSKKKKPTQTCIRLLKTSHFLKIIIIYSMN